MDVPELRQNVGPFVRRVRGLRVVPCSEKAGRSRSGREPPMSQQHEATCAAIHDEEVSLVEFALHTVYHHDGCSDDRCRFCRERKAKVPAGEPR